MSDFESDGLTERASVKSWIFAFAVCLLMLGGFSWIKYGPPEFLNQSAGSIGDSPLIKPDKKTKRSKKKGRRSGKKGVRADDEPSWENDDDYDDPGIELGDIFESEDEAPEEVVDEEPEYIPPPEVYQASGSYKPTASYREKGASISNATTLDMSSSESSSALRDDQLKSVLTIRRLMPCYERYASKVPQMKGRVSLRAIVEKDGHVSLVEVQDSALRSKVVEQCLVDTVRRLRFPKAGLPTKFTQRYTFK